MSGAAPGKKTMDVHGVAALLRTLLAEGQDEQVIELVVGLLWQLVEKNTELELRLRKALRQHFGRQSEKLSAEQLSLLLVELGQGNAGPREATQPGAGEARLEQGATSPPEPPREEPRKKVLDRQHPNGLKRGHMWVYLGDSTWAAFVYTPDWKQEGPLSFLEGREGWLLVDGYKGYDKLFTREGATAVEVGCWSHARRYFVEALEAGDTRAALPLSLIGRLFEVEREADEQRVDEAERLRRRDTHSRPVTEQLGRWVADTWPREPPRSPLAQACRDALNQWTALLRFLEDARLPLHNNASEPRPREIAVGRKNDLFAGSDAGAERAACVYTLVATCVLAGVDPWAYLTDVLEKLAQGWPQRRLVELLPPMWKATREAAAQTPSTSPTAT